MMGALHRERQRPGLRPPIIFSSGTTSNGYCAGLAVTVA